MKRLQIELPNDLHLTAKIKAAKTGISMAEICRRALTKWVEQDETPQDNDTKDKPLPPTKTPHRYSISTPEQPRIVYKDSEK